ncbi:hypothetical protein ACFPME_11675 [Rhodanobacter umsongensis]|uniref:PH domain-containing protein n=1 Tax=Rhodanobacter umsongensis TaxID=633153 RepID=A0ABW0JN71_9GAMM
MTQNETTQEWRLTSASASTVLPVVIPLLMLAVGLVMLIASGLGKVQTTDFNFGFLVVWVCLVLWLTYKALSMPRRIAIEPGGWLSFRSPLGETRMRAQDVVSISPKRSQLGYMQLEYQGGKLQFIAQFDGFHTFLNRLTELNPAVVLEGC